MKTYKLYLFGEVLYTSKDILLIEAFKNTYNENLKRYLIIK